MQRNSPPSEQTTTVLLALSEEPAAWRHGYDCARRQASKAGSIYPILMRLADRGWLETAWETEIPAGRPRRHLYRLMGAGLELASQLATAKAGDTQGKRPRLRLQTEGAQ